MARPPAGLATQPLAIQRDRVLAAWDAFGDLAAAVDLARPSRLPGWSAHDVCVHLGDWPGASTLDDLVASARTGRASLKDVDAANAAVVAAHRDAPRSDVLGAIARARDRIASWFDSPEPAELGLRPTMSSIGPLPLLTTVSAGAYELAVHALDLAGPRPPRALLDAGLAALVDVTGYFAHQGGLRTTLTAWTGTEGWQVQAAPQGWATGPVRARKGAVIEGDPTVLLDASAGRRAIPQLLLARTLRIHGLPEIVRLAPIVDEIPNLPGGPALKAAGRWIGVFGRLLR